MRQASHIWGEAWVWRLCHQAQIGGVSQWYLSFSKFLTSLYKITELNQRDHLDHLFNRDPSRSSPVFQTSCINEYGGQSLLWSFNTAEIFRSLPQICLNTILSQLCMPFLWPHGLVLALTSFSVVKYYIDTCVCLSKSCLIDMQHVNTRHLEWNFNDSESKQMAWRLFSVLPFLINLQSCYKSGFSFLIMVVFSLCLLIH